ncbi:unnamed protein product [Danaus chrysippus]|uniref:(African queen) hypothetical protein n=1 Tax=Danaus chrysippus TaxID=151541 RepID=A0A8J2R536_9NEOP|nr:unnamed protein product [Danaus chrysippus]
MWAKLLLLLLSMYTVNMDLQLWNPGGTSNRRHRRTSGCNTNVYYDKVLLKNATLRSQYIFTGKVNNVSFGNTSRTYSVNISRVMKGNINDISANVKYKTINSVSFIDTTISVRSLKSLKCSTLRVRTYAIFLTKCSKYRQTLRLNLVIDPVLLTLRNIDIIEAAIKGEP